MQVYIENTQKQIEIGPELMTLVEKAAGMCVGQELPGYECEMNIIMTDSGGIREFNKKYRGKNSETDVLSFPVLQTNGNGVVIEPGDMDMDSGLLQLGDVVISPQRAKVQAAELGHSFEREMLFLVTHGVFHLLGYDHNGDDSEMFDRQEAVLAKIGLSRDGIDIWNAGNNK